MEVVEYCEQGRVYGKGWSPRCRVNANEGEENHLYEKRVSPWLDEKNSNGAWYGDAIFREAPLSDKRGRLCCVNITTKECRRRRKPY